MTSVATQVRRAEALDEIRPLVELCKAGKLFEVQAWIASGKPVNPPPPPSKGNRSKTPLEIAIDRGFHSLVEVLLQGGAAFETEGWNCPINTALRMRRFDMVKLLVEHGCNPQLVRMAEVFDTWDPDIMEYFIEKGADVESDKPLACALTNRIRTALRVFKRYKDRFPSFQEQANIALRYHCKEGNMKWISLMLWAGADPYAPGTDIHILARHGAKWIPKDKRQVDLARRSLMKLKPDYTVEYVWIMSKYKACTKDSLHNLLRTSSITSHISGHSQRVWELLSSWS
jgi:hypothetical protein